MKKNNEIGPVGIWFRVLGLLIISLLLWGVVSPMLVSNSESDLGVILGIIIIFLVPVIWYYVLYPVYKQLK